MPEDYTGVWEALQKKHVLLLVDTHVDPSTPNSGGYNLPYFESKAEEIYQWFESIIASRAGATDFLMVNGAWLCIRPLVPAPVLPTKPDLKIMVLR